MQNVTLKFLLAVAPDITDITEDMVVSRGETVTLTCGGIGDTPHTVSWLTPSGQVYTNYIVERDRSLPSHSWVAQNVTIRIISAADGGTYTCRAANEGGSAVASMMVFVHPYFAIEPLDILTTNGSSETAVCRAEAFPQPTVLWVVSHTYFGSGSGSGFEIFGEELENNVSEYLIHNESLTFNPVTFGDEQFVYQCVASNDYGDVHTTMKITSKCNRALACHYAIGRISY